MAGKTLAASIPQFNADLNRCLNDAMYEAFMTSLGKGDDVDPTISATITADMEIAARKYSMKFASVLAPRLADAIYKFVSEIGINLSPKGTLLAPQAISGVLPVTGTASTSTKDIVVI